MGRATRANPAIESLLFGGVDSSPHRRVVSYGSGSATSGEQVALEAHGVAYLVADALENSLLRVMLLEGFELAIGEVTKVEGKRPGSGRG
jgi:hypothetical protein